MYGFIINERSGNGRGAKVWEKVESFLKDRNIPYCFRITEKAGHGTQLVHEMLGEKNLKAIVAVGGDGTVNEVINGLIGSDKPLGILPSGSGNDLCRALNIPLNWKGALQRVLECNIRTIDLGEVTCRNDKPRFFTTVTGIGFDGQVAQTTNESFYKGILNKFQMGKAVYILSVFKVLMNFKPSNIELSIDDNRKYVSNVWLVAVANSSFYGGGMKISPQAKIDDGWLDVCIVQNLSKWGLIKLFPYVYQGKHIHHPSVTTFRCKTIDIQSDVPFTFHTDGEIIGQTPLLIRTNPNCLHVV
ncbi:diacylglycerol kinase family protein [Alkalihalobacillus sp. AL-G]|uniref:diacylglycerol/lipid kinase family protein n=1 Tax=Alkalihalobacillus sp. AL-G TaxID=2926399 RepID=UPI00272ABB08|nr:diacylglycerol kinase family protein [Alkalihalobacillus sp. AL-G]WLD93873.1 diacylglycerol kinase family lipid kinase [Alkalihalobacillus sp. AL-G]